MKQQRKRSEQGLTTIITLT